MAKKVCCKEGMEMAKNKEINTEEITPDGSRAINKFRVSDALIMILLGLLCLTCISYLEKQATIR